MKKLLFVDRYFYPDLQATSVILTDLAAELAKDHETSVICGPASNFSASAESKKPDFIKQVKIKTLPVFQFNNPSFGKRFLNYASFLLLAPFAVLFHPAADAVLVQSSPPMLPFVVSLACFLRRFPCVYVCQDFFPGTATRSGQLKESWWTKLFERFHRAALRLAARVVVIGRDMKETLLSEGAPPEKIICISNWADASEIKPIGRDNSFARANNLCGGFVVMHAGNFGLVQDFDFLLEVAGCLEDKQNLQFVFVGGGASKESVVQKARAKNLTNVRFLPFAERHLLSEVLASANLHVISLKRGLAGYSVPSKIYSLIASARPVLGLLERRSESARVIMEAGCGAVFENETKEEVARWIKDVSEKPGELATWGRNARTYAATMDFRKRAFAQYRELLKEVAG